MTPPPEGQTESEGLIRHYGWDKLIPADLAREAMGEEHEKGVSFLVSGWIPPFFLNLNWLEA